MDIEWACFKTFVLSFPTPPWGECFYCVCGDSTHVWICKGGGVIECRIDIMHTADLENFTDNYKSLMNQ